MATTTHSKPQSDCPCGSDKLTVMMDKIDEKLVDASAKHIKAIKYDVANDIDMSEMIALMSLKRAFMGRSSLCSDCFSEFDLATICSKILRILYK